MRLWFKGSKKLWNVKEYIVPKAAQDNVDGVIIEIIVW